MIAKQRKAELRTIEGELFVIVDGLSVGKRHAGKWIAIEPGWSVLELESGKRL